MATTSNADAKQRMQQNLAVFAALSSTLEEDAALREKIRDHCREFDSHVRALLAHLNAIHAIPSSEFKQLASESDRFLPACVSSLRKIIELVPQNQFYRYNDQYSRSVQSLCFAIVLIHWLLHDDLITREDAEKTMGITPEVDNFKLSIEDYLQSIVSLVNELARLCPNSIVNSDFALPLAISKFCKEIHAGFGLLNLKNDSLRKRFDGMKYDIKKMEEVVYDISLRGLVPSAAAEASHSVPSKRPREDVASKSEEMVA